EHRFNDTWQFKQNLRYTKSEMSFQQLTVGAYAYAPVDAAGNMNRLSTNVDENIGQFAVDNNFQADFATGDVTHTLLLGLDHQRTDTSYLSIYGG
ncbi:TonB-dependent siderophore receptor, partial [Klebsiella quasipneumoniae]|nr:TonB-dependent siderophore receptor [Klebsiella quasipneumoniae]